MFKIITKKDYNMLKSLAKKSIENKLNASVSGFDNTRLEDELYEANQKN